MARNTSPSSPHHHRGTVVGRLASALFVSVPVLALVACASTVDERAPLGESEADLTKQELDCAGYDSAAADKLARTGASRDGRRSQKKCFSFVKQHLTNSGHDLPADIAPGGRYGGSAYMFTTWARRNPEALRKLGFKEVTVSRGEAPPKGAIIVWGRGECGYSKSHGHIEVVSNDAGTRACSDFCGNLKTARKCGIPDVFVPIRPDGQTGPACVDEKDSCSGKTDGWYCSELRDFSAYKCKNANIEIGFQCGTGKKCVFSGTEKTATLENGVPQCR